MTMTRLRLPAFALGAAALLSSTALAQTVDANAFAERLSAVSTAQGSPIRYDGATTEGDAVVLSNVRIGEPANELNLGTVRFETVSGSNSEGWRAERVPFEPVDSTQDDTSTRVSGATLEGLTIEPETPGEPSITALDVERMAVQSVEIDRGGEEALRMSGIELTNSPGQENGYQIEFSVDEFAITPDAGRDGEGVSAMTQIGYERLVGDVSGSGLWNTQSGELTLSPLLLRIQDAAELSIAYSITGYTPAFIQALAQAQSRMAADPENPGAGIAMMGLMAQLTVNSAEIVLRDQSLTNRLLDYYAGENNQTREQMIDGLVGSLPAVLAYVNNPEFQAQVSQAVEAFLRNPGVLTVAVAPNQPLPASQIVGAALAAPQTLPAVLNLTVTAND